MTIKDTDNFLREIGMHPDCTDIAEVTEAFLSEMEAGLAGRASSLMMIPTYIGAGGEAPDHEPAVVMDAGGTHFRRALVAFRGGRPEIAEYLESPMPGTRGPITKDEFLDQVAEHILPLLKESRRIGFCFSYPAHILPNRDGVLTAFNKEVRVSDSQGMVIGQALLGKLRELGIGGELRFTLLNDTVACLLGGLASSGGRSFDGAAGLILGTGTNACYVERGDKIKKLPGAPDMVINMESGGFNKLGAGESDRLFDQTTANPGDHIFEKMVSGAYHGGVMAVTARLAAGAGLLSSGFAGADAFEMSEIDEFLERPFGPGRLAALCRGESDVAALHTLIDRSFERAGKLVCANVAALALARSGGKKPQTPFGVAAEGSAFYKSRLFRGKLDYYVRVYINETLGRHVEFIRAENSNLTGAALAALLN